MKHFALAGNPNCGKTTLFNNLTGSTAHVVNWPGVTVEKREGIYKKLKEPVSIVDLPGIYSEKEECFHICHKKFLSIRTDLYRSFKNRDSDFSVSASHQPLDCTY